MLPHGLLQRAQGRLWIFRLRPSELGRRMSGLTAHRILVIKTLSRGRVIPCDPAHGAACGRNFLHLCFLGFHTNHVFPPGPEQPSKNLRWLRFFSVSLG